MSFLDGVFRVRRTPKPSKKSSGGSELSSSGGRQSQSRSTRTSAQVRSNSRNSRELSHSPLNSSCLNHAGTIKEEMGQVYGFDLELIKAALKPGDSGSEARRVLGNMGQEGAFASSVIDSLASSLDSSMTATEKFNQFTTELAVRVGQGITTNDNNSLKVNTQELRTNQNYERIKQQWVYTHELSTQKHSNTLEAMTAKHALESASEETLHLGRLSLNQQNEEQKIGMFNAAQEVAYHQQTIELQRKKAIAELTAGDNLTESMYYTPKKGWNEAASQESNFGFFSAARRFLGQ